MFFDAASIMYMFENREVLFFLQLFHIFLDIGTKKLAQIPIKMQSQSEFERDS